MIFSVPILLILKNMTYSLQRPQCKDGVMPKKPCVNLNDTRFHLNLASGSLLSCVRPSVNSQLALSMLANCRWGSFSVTEQKKVDSPIC